MGILEAMRNVYYGSITNNIIVTQCYKLLKNKTTDMAILPCFDEVCLTGNGH